jgi:hypothetical protein
MHHNGRFAFGQGQFCVFVKESTRMGEWAAWPRTAVVAEGAVRYRVSIE